MPLPRIACGPQQVWTSQSTNLVFHPLDPAVMQRAASCVRIAVEAAPDDEAPDTPVDVAPPSSADSVRADAEQGGEGDRSRDEDEDIAE